MGRQLMIITSTENLTTSLKCTVHELYTHLYRTYRYSQFHKQHFINRNFTRNTYTHLYIHMLCTYLGKLTTEIPFGLG